MRGLVLLFFLAFFTVSYGQEDYSSIVQKNVIKVSDTIKLDSLSIQRFGFKLKSKNLSLIDSTLYKVNFAKAELYLKSKEIESDSIEVTYFRYPSYITQSYQGLDPALIISKNKGADRLYKLRQSNLKKSTALFEGLVTSGSISRGISLGNNQNSIFNSELDLQISGNLSDKVTLKASLQDSNIPIQEGGFSQSIDEFDQIFIELTGEKWGVRAGDIQLSNQKSVFANYTKKLQGLSVKTKFEGANSQTNAHLSGALVRGQYNRSTISGQEGNQGPYKLIGQGGELFVLIVSGSERVYVNGLLLKRGENNDYIIDYNAGEIRFNSIYPITADMRIVVEYQTSQRNFARIFGSGGVAYASKKTSFETFIYSEKDLKNQTLQQDLNDSQKEILSKAGDDEFSKKAPSAILDTFEENKVLYRIRTINNIPNGTPITTPTEKFIYDVVDTTVPLIDTNEKLFQVRFTRVNQGEGDYALQNPNSVERIFEFVGFQQGNFSPIIQLQAPTKLQVAVVLGSYKPTEKTNFNFEIAASSNDLNLFSSIDDDDNNGAAARLNLKQKLLGKNINDWQSNFVVGIDWVQKDYRSIERLYNIEFNRDWNLSSNSKDQSIANSNNQLLSNIGFVLSHSQKGILNYDFQLLDFGNRYSGTRNSINAEFKFKKWSFINRSSILESTNQNLKSNFSRSYSNINYANKQFWIGGKYGLEANKEKDKITQQFSNNSQRYNFYEVYTGIGDSTKIYAKVGYRYRENDSLQNNRIKKVSTSNTVYLNSQLINSQNSRLSLFMNYRVQNDNREAEKDKNLNSRLLYRQKLWNNKVQWNTAIETQSGTLPQQDFTFVEVDPSRGQYTWNDYNNDGVQDLLEFELSPFQDQATFIRILLPRQIFIRTYQNKLSQQFTFNFLSWDKATDYWKRFASHFYNQISYIIDRRVKREGTNLNFNIFEDSDNDLGLNSNFRNSIFFNRGKKNFTTNYTYLNSASNNILITGEQSNSLCSHSFNFSHKIKETWLFDSQIVFDERTNEVKNSLDRNYFLKGNELTPKISYLLSDQNSISLSYTSLNRKNIQAGKEELNQQKITTSFRFASKQNTTITGSFNWFENDFKGNSLTPTAFQLLSGLQPKTNFTWNLLAQKKLTKFLEMNIDYNGRKSETSKTIHSGSIQLRAFF